MGKRDNREQIAKEITRELEKATGLAWEPRIFRGTSTIEYSVEQYNLYFMFYVYGEDNPDYVRIEKHCPVNISIDELYDLIDCFNRICTYKHSLFFDLREDRQIYNFMDLIDIYHCASGTMRVEANKNTLEKIEAAIKKGSLSVVDLKRMDKLDKHYRESLTNRDVLIIDAEYDKFAILFDND